MKAAIYKGNQTFSVENIPIPEPGPDQVLVKIKLSAICGTDVHAFMYDLAPPGTVLGHEFTGTIEKIGSSVTKWKIGDSVVGGGGVPPPSETVGPALAVPTNIAIATTTATKLRTLFNFCDVISISSQINREKVMYCASN